jgi:hypothetical protein
MVKEMRLVGKPLEVMARDPTKLVIGLPGRVEQRELHAVVALQVRRRQGRSRWPSCGDRLALPAQAKDRRIHGPVPNLVVS